MTEDIWINIDEHDTKFFKHMGGKTGKQYVKAVYDNTGGIKCFEIILYLDGTISDDYVDVVEKDEKTLKLIPCGKYYNALNKFEKKVWDCELFSEEEFEGIGEKNILLHLL